MRHPVHDYTGAAGYFITFVTHDRHPILGSLEGENLKLYPAGETVLRSWNSLPKAFAVVYLDCIQLMPDHVHCILYLLPQTGEEPIHLSRVIGSFKQHAARRINEQHGTQGEPVWQRGFIDRVIRNEQELEKFRNYIVTNPIRLARGL